MITIKENSLDTDTYLGLRASVKWKLLGREQADTALKNSLFTVCVYDNDKPVGMGRIVGDGVVIDYIQDLVVTPDMQGRGIGRIVIDRLIKYVRETEIDIVKSLYALKAAPWSQSQGKHRKGKHYEHIDYRSKRFCRQKSD